MSSSFPIRIATAQDAEALATLVSSAYRGESSRAVDHGNRSGRRQPRRCGASPLGDRLTDDVILMHEAEGELLAVHLQRTAEGCYLGMLTTKPTSQGSDWADGCWKKPSVSRARRGGHGDAHDGHHRAFELLAWYERRGYARTGERKPFHTTMNGSASEACGSRVLRAAEILDVDHPTRLRRRRFIGSSPAPTRRDHQGDTGRPRRQHIGHRQELQHEGWQQRWMEAS